VPQRLPHYLAFEEKLRDAERIAAILLETEAETAPEANGHKPLRASADGHRKDRMRGFPIIAKGVSGTMPGTDPLRHLLSQENKRRRR
jgi:hypothetical protein